MTKSKCKICGFIHGAAMCPYCKTYNMELIGDTNPIKIFVKKSIFRKINNHDLTGILFHKDKKSLRYSSKKLFVEFFNKQFSFIKDIEYLIPIIIQSRIIILNGNVLSYKSSFDNIELAKICFSLGFDVSNKGERKKLIEHARDNFGLPFQGWYLRFK